MIHSVISKEQFAFVEGRQILECIVTLQNVIEDARERKTDLIGYKIDFEKAYDSIDWCYLEDIMRAMNFNNKWISWIMACISTAHIFVLVNGSPSGDFKMGRGLRQGDPLSPLLFIIAAESISTLLYNSISSGMFTPACVGTERMKVSHLQFADDTMFLGRATL